MLKHLDQELGSTCVGPNASLRKSGCAPGYSAALTPWVILPPSSQSKERPAPWKNCLIFNLASILLIQVSCLQLCVLLCFTHEGRASHIYCRGIRWTSQCSFSLWRVLCLLHHLCLLISPAPPLPPALPVPPASSLPPVLPLIPDLLFGPCTTFSFASSAQWGSPYWYHTGHSSMPLWNTYWRLAGINQQELLPWRGHSCQPHEKQC